MKILRIKQAIQIGETPSIDIFNLPCVESLITDPLRFESIYGFYYKVRIQDDVVTAVTGDWICEDENGNWGVLDSNEYKLYFTKHETK